MANEYFLLIRSTLIKKGVFMCTAIVRGNLAGRTLDYECSFGESVAVLPKDYSFRLVHEGELRSKHRIIGICHMADGIPLFYDGINDCGVGAFALNFPEYAFYSKKKEEKLNLASFELIPFVLSQSSSLSEALSLIDNLNITDDSFSKGLLPTPLHWLVCDTERCAVIEPLASEVKVWDNPVGVMTNSPPLDYHLTRLSELVSLHPGNPVNRLIKDKKTEPYSGGMGAMGLPGDYSSVSRFLRAAFVKTNTVTGNEGDVESFFHIMGSVEVPLGCSLSLDGDAVKTIYTSCADLQNGVYYYTTYENRTKKCVGFSSFAEEDTRFFSL